MEKIIEFRNNNFAYNGTNAFNDFNMEINEGDIVTLVGPGGSGKTTLLKMLCNRLPNDSVYYREKNLKSCNIDEIRHNIVIVFDTPINAPTVRSELVKYLKILKFNDEDITSRLKEMDKYFGIERIMDTNPKDLSKDEEYLIKLLRYLIIKPAFIGIDNVLTYLFESDIKKFFDFVKKNNITVLNITNDLNLALYGNKLLVIEDFVLILEGNPLSVLKTDTLLKRLGLALPIAVDLSIELIHYDVLKKIYTDKEKLVNALWK